MEIKKIDNLIQKMQSNNDNHDFIVEWIPYNHFSYIKELGENKFSTIYSAIWEDGLLEYDRDKCEYVRRPDTKVNLKRIYNSQNISNEFLSEV